MDEHAEENATGTDAPVCPHCIEPVDPLDHFCPKCGGPITAHAAIDPLGQVYTMGYGYQNSTTACPRKITLIGMWLIFGPQVLVLFWIGGIAIFDQLSRGAGEGFPNHNALGFGFGRPEFDWLQAIFMIALTALYITILWKVTARYLTSRSTADTPDEATA